jgi:hypothetical protein
MKSMLNNNSMMDDATPLEFYLGQNYPNPFREKTVIKYCVAYKSRVQLTVYNSEGKVIQKLVDEEQKAGTYQAEFHSMVGGKQLDVGYYYCRLEADDYNSEKKMEIEK